DLIEAGEWMLAPKDKNGVPHPEMAPNVVNNSWGGGPEVNDWYKTIVTNWRAANIFPEFSAGNTTQYNPGGPGSVANPANYQESFATGATDINNNLANFSLRGPSPYGGILKPDISAPGVNIRSSVPGGKYEGGWNGTSMAGPHTSGLVALLLQSNSSLTVSEIERIIKETATPSTNSEYPETPNNGYGYGVINAFKAVTSVMTGLAEIKGQVSEENTEKARLPLSATVTIVENGRSTKTNPQDGSYSFKVKEGEYTLRAEQYGYYPHDQKVQVAANQVLENTNITLAPIPKRTLTGKITNAQTGKPVKNAKVYLIEDAAVAPVTTDADGNYSITGYEGKYTVQVTAENYFDEKFTVDITGNENVSHDLQLKPFINFPGEIGYDDGTAEYSVGQWEAGGGFAVRMSLPEGETTGIVTSGLFMLDTTYGKTFKVAVYDASGKDGAPGKMIAGPFNATASKEIGKWTVVDLSAQQIVVTGDFYMVLIQDQMAPQSPAIALDKTTVPTRRSWVFVKDGPFTIASKDYGNVMIRSTVKLEALAPVITSPVDNLYVNNEKVTIKGMAAPGMDVHIFSGDKDIANGKTNDDGSFSIDAVLQEGVNILKAKTITEIGSTLYSKETKVIVDKTAPVLEISSPQNNAYMNSQLITVTGTVKDDLDYVDVNGTKVDIDSNGNWTAKLISKEGKNVINVVARDKAGNETAKSITVNVKYSISEIKNIMPSSDVILKADQTLKVGFDSEPGLKKAVFTINAPINGITSAAFVPTASLSNFEVVMTEVKDAKGNGTGHYEGYWKATNKLILNGAQIVVKVEDMYGNSLSSTAAGKLYVVYSKPIPKPVPDKTAPSIPLVSKVTYTGISGKAEIGSNVYAKAGKVIIGSSVVNSKGIYSITFKSQKVGTIINVYAVDKSGNVGAAKKVVIKDITPPAIPSVKSITNTKVTGKAEPGAKVYVKKGKVIIGSSTANSKGIYTVSYKKQKVGTVLYVYAKDKAGNTGKAKKVVVKK
ncbi:Ig-like domain-containing protein, partial [Bacillus sp. FJAT-25509]|uniref:S8 family serine peptidase n=1 Tax=Bacillus sp. FJAT-25509 TaxID=1712029 RepID=UPI0009E94D13